MVNNTGLLKHEYNKIWSQIRLTKLSLLAWLASMWGGGVPENNSCCSFNTVETSKDTYTEIFTWLTISRWKAKKFSTNCALITQWFIIFNISFYQQIRHSVAPSRARIIITSKMSKDIWSFVYIYERPILGDNPKPHKILLKSAVLFSTFHGVVLFTEKCCTFHWKATKTADSTRISHYDLVFQRVQREGQLITQWFIIFNILFCQQIQHSMAPSHTRIIITSKMSKDIWSFVYIYIYKRPILGDNPKPHKILLKSSAFQHFSWSYTFYWKVLHFSLKSNKNSWFNTDLSLWPGVS